MIKRLSIFLSAFFVISLSNQSFALPNKHLTNGQDTGWSYPLDDNTNGQPTQNITFGFMSYNNSNYPYHYAQDITKGYKEGDSVYAMSEGKIIRIRRSGGYGGGNPCNSTYNTLVVEHNYFKKDGTIGVVYVFYGHVKNILGLPQNATNQEITVAVPVMRGQKIAELNDPSCAGWSSVHLHLAVMPDSLPVDYYDGYNNTQVKNGRARPFDCSNNTNGLWSKDWVDESGTQNIPIDDDVFFDTYKPAGLVAYYPFNGNANDESGNGNNGTVYGATLTTDRFGYANSAYSFDGVDNYIDVENTIDFQLTTWSITGWINVNNFPSSSASILGKNADSNLKYNFVLLLGSDKKVRSQYETCSSDFDHPLYSDTIQSNDWVFFSSSSDETSGTHSLYLNGTEVDSGTWTGTPCANNEKLRVGHQLRTGATKYFNGVIDDIRIYNRALSASEIQELYTGGPDADGDGYPANVDCNDNDPTVNPGKTEGPYGNATCTDGKDNDCDHLIDAGDPGCQQPTTDLTVTTLTGPTTGVPGLTINVTDTTKNNGPGSAPASTTKFYWSTNTAWDAGDTYLGSRAIPSLAALATNKGTITVTVPSGACSGTFYIIAKADADNLIAETKETNNTKYKSIKTGPDLIVSTVTAPTTSGAGKTISVTDTTKNQGGCPSVASTTKLYFSTNSTWDTGDTYLGERAVPALALGATSTGSTSVTIPAGTTTKTSPYYIIAKADANNTNPKETSEANNKKSKSIKIGPDLIVSSLSAPTSAARGSTISVTDTTKNNGGGDAGDSTTKFYLSTDTKYDAGVDTPLPGGERPVPALAALATNTGSTNVTIPTSIATGPYYIIALADDGNVVVETNETNNKKTKAITINP